MRDFFRGKTSLRTKGEWLSLGLTIVIGPTVLAIAGQFIHEAAGYSTIIFLALVAMVYVTLARGQLLGSCVLIDKGNFPQVLHVVERCASLLGVPVPLVFVRDDIQSPVVALGFGEPYSLVLSSHWLKHFKEDELTFMVGRELGNIAAGHTRITSLLSVNGRENALISLIFGAFLRRTEYTADRLGLLCCGSTDAAERAIMMSTFHHFGREIDIASFARQRDTFGNDSILAMGEWLTAQPYATNRIAELRTFRASTLYAYWEDRILSNPISMAAFSPVPRTGTVQRGDCAGFGRRIAAIAIDLVAVWGLFILGPSAGVVQTDTPAAQSGAPAAQSAQDASQTRAQLGRLVGIIPRKTGYTFLVFAGLPQEFLVYNIVLVALCGQTLGMMVLAVKVTRTDFKRPSVWQTIWRYLVSPAGIFSYLMGPFARIEWHDRLSATRVVTLERTFERAPALADGAAANA